VDEEPAPPNTTPTVFISYAWADELSALAIDQWLRNRGARVLIDRRDFIPGNDIEAEIVRCIMASGKIVCLYSRNSASRPYPELERRITSALEKEDARLRNSSRRKLIYFAIDGTPLPTEALPRLAIRAEGMAFETACEELWQDALRHKRGKGERVGNIQFGYRLALDGCHVEPDASEQLALQAIRKLRLGGHTLRGIASARRRSASGGRGSTREN
jgi:hypothetical protein